MSATAPNRTVLALVALAALLDAVGAFAAERWQPVTFKPIFAPSPLPSDGTVQFPNDSSIDVTFRTRTPEHPTSTALEEYPTQLRAAQQGNAVAARKVGNRMVYCALVRGIPFSTPNTQTFKGLSVRKDESSRTSAVREFCEQRSVEEIASGVTWLQTAAANGDATALKRLTGLYRPGSEEQVEALNDLWQQQGSIRTLQELADVHGWRSLHSGSESPDAILSLAAYWLYARLNESAWRQDSSISAFVEALGRDVTNRLDGASPHVRIEALAFARKILSESPRCCLVYE